MFGWVKIVPIILCAVAAAFFWLAQPMSLQMERFLSPKSKLDPVATIKKSSGRLFRQTENGGWADVKGKKEVHVQSGEKRRLGPESSLELSISPLEKSNPSFEVRLSKEAEFTVRRWRSDDLRSPIYLYLFSGHLRLLKSGEAGRLFVIQHGQYQNPHQMNPTPVAPVTLGSITSDNTALPNSKNDNSAAVSPTLIPTPTQEPILAITLTNEMIEKRLQLESENFYRCQANSLRQNDRLQGQILMQLTIAPNGKIKEIQNLKNEPNDEQLTKCVDSVLRRVEFSPFKSEKIVFNFPLQFE